MLRLGAALLVLCGALSLLSTGHAHANATVNMRLTIKPLECTLETVQDGTRQVTYLVPAGCEQAVEHHALPQEIAQSVSPKAQPLIATENKTAWPVFGQAVALLWMPMMVPFSYRQAR